MKAFFIFRISADYPNEARTIKFRTMPEAEKELRSFVSRDAWFFDHKCWISSNRNHRRVKVFECSTRKYIETKIVRCDVDDNIPFYYHI